MNEDKKYWQQADWNCLSAKRKYEWSVASPGDWQDILSTYDCLVEIDSEESKSSDEDSR